MLLLFLTTFALMQFRLSNVFALILEAEDGVFTGNATMRSAASGGAAVLVKDKQDVLQMFSTTSSCNVQISNIRYSDGSSADVCTVFINGKNIGEFRTTTEPCTSTDQWNEFYNSGTIGSTLLQMMGQHLVRVTVNATDEFGVELDVFELSIDCDRATEGDSNSNDSGLTVEEIAGIAAGGFTLAIFLIVTFCVICNCRCKEEHVATPGRFCTE